MSKPTGARLGGWAGFPSPLSGPSPVDSGGWSDGDLGFWSDIWPGRGIVRVPQEAAQTAAFQRVERTCAVASSERSRAGPPGRIDGRACPGLLMQDFLVVEPVGEHEAKPGVRQLLVLEPDLNFYGTRIAECALGLSNETGGRPGKQNFDP